MTKREIMLTYMLMYLFTCPEEERHKIGATANSLLDLYDDLIHGEEGFKKLRIALESMMDVAAESVADEAVCDFINKLTCRELDSH